MQRCVANLWGRQGTLEHVIESRHSGADHSGKVSDDVVVLRRTAPGVAILHGCAETKGIFESRQGLR
jgi:hypothetical protein